VIWIIVIVVVALVLLWWWMGRPNYYRGIQVGDLERFFDSLMNRSTLGSLLFIKHQKSERFIQFAKHGSESSPVLHFGFPDAPWSRQYFSPLVSALQENGFQCRIRGTGIEPTVRFLEVDIPVGPDTTKRGAFLARISLECMGLDATEKLRVHLEGEVSRETALSDVKQLQEHSNPVIRRLGNWLAMCIPKKTK